MLEKMQKDHDEIALHGLLRADAQLLDLLDQVGDIEAVQSPSSQEPCLFLDPEVEVALVERRMVFGHRMRACHVTALIKR